MERSPGASQEEVQAQQRRLSPPVAQLFVLSMAQAFSIERDEAERMVAAAVAAYTRGLLLDAVATMRQVRDLCAGRQSRSWCSRAGKEKSRGIWCCPQPRP